jgi:hypothetical protein
MLGHACGKQNDAYNQGDENTARPWIIHLFNPADVPQSSVISTGERIQ